MTTSTELNALADRVEALVEKKQIAAVSRDDDRFIPGSAIRRVSKVNDEISLFIGENWPVITAALRALASQKEAEG